MHTAIPVNNVEILVGTHCDIVYLLNGSSHIVNLVWLTIKMEGFGIRPSRLFFFDLICFSDGSICTCVLCIVLCGAAMQHKYSRDTELFFHWRSACNSANYRHDTK